MGNDKSKSNIIAFQGDNDRDAGPGKYDCGVEDVSEFMVDMLDTLMRIAAKEEQSLLVYFLAMARIEAMEMKALEGEEKGKSDHSPPEPPDRLV